MSVKSQTILLLSGFSRKKTNFPNKKTNLFLYFNKKMNFCESYMNGFINKLDIE